MYTVFCQQCGCLQSESSYRVACVECGGLLDFRYESAEFRKDNSCNSIWRFRSVLPIRKDSTPISLGEGQTPLQRSRFHEKISVYFKNEGLNPTGSHKDRALSIGVTKALEFDRKVVMLYSDGSTALSSAAYAAKAGLKSITVLPKATPRFRSLPLALYDSRLLEYQGNPAEALDWVHQACLSLGIYETSNYRRANPYESEGAKTIGLEIFEQLGDVPDWIVVPVGGGGTLAGIWRAFVELKQRRMSAKCPHMVAVLPEGYQLLETAWRRRVSTEEELRALTRQEVPSTIQAKIAMPYPPDGLEAITAIRYSEGMFTYASDSEAVGAQKRLGAFEGIYAEPSAAVALVAVEKLISTTRVLKGQSIVAIITGSGFRETETIASLVGSTSTPVSADSGIALLERILTE